MDRNYIIYNNSFTTLILRLAFGRICVKIEKDWCSYIVQNKVFCNICCVIQESFVLLPLHCQQNLSVGGFAKLIG